MKCPLTRSFCAIMTILLEKVLHRWCVGKIPCTWGRMKKQLLKSQGEPGTEKPISTHPARGKKIVWKRRRYYNCRRKGSGKRRLTESREWNLLHDSPINSRNSLFHKERKLVLFHSSVGARSTGLIQRLSYWVSQSFTKHCRVNSREQLSDLCSSHKTTRVLSWVLIPNALSNSNPLPKDPTSQHHGRIKVSAFLIPHHGDPTFTREVSRDTHVIFKPLRLSLLGCLKYNYFTLTGIDNGFLYHPTLNIHQQYSSFFVILMF